jgi:hypothetical protein
MTSNSVSESFHCSAITLVLLKLFTRAAVVTTLTAKTTATVALHTVPFVPTLLSFTLFNLLPQPSTARTGPFIRSYII